MEFQATPHNRAGELALEIYRKTLSRITGRSLVLESVQLDGDELKVGSETFDLSRYQRLFVCGAGKASPSMVQGLEELLGDRISGGLVVTKYGHSVGLRFVREVEAGHPVPDENSLRAGAEMLEFAGRCKPDDLVIFALSGGASALMESLEPEITLADLQVVNRELLASGATIVTLNAIRSRLSRIKAGGLALAFPCQVLCLIMSDVEGDRLNTIGSGPFVPPMNVQMARLLNAFDFQKTLPPSVVKLLRKPASRTHRKSLKVPHYVLANSRSMGRIAVGIARDSGLTLRNPFSMSGNARSAFQFFVDKGLIPGLGGPASSELDSFISTGETTIEVLGTGQGGRAQEMAIVVAKMIDRMENIAVLIAGSDGTDGPTDAAGALVDGGTMQRARSKGCEFEKMLADNDSYHFHEAADSLIKTGPTGSNLNDIVIFVRK